MHQRQLLNLAKSLVLAVMVILLQMKDPALASVIDSPHTEANAISCSTCHSYSAWWQYSPLFTKSDYSDLADAVCNRCHSSAGSAFVKVGHSTSSMGKPHPVAGSWSTKCVDCHDPHTQQQLGWLPLSPLFNDGTMAGDFFLVEGKMTSITDNGDGTTTFQYTNGLAKSGWQDASVWTKKSGHDGRGLILSLGYGKADHTYEVTAAAVSTVMPSVLPATGAGTITVQTGSDPFPGQYENTAFGLFYGQLVKNVIITPHSGKRDVKFFDGKDGLVTTSVTPRDGVCQVCHTLTKFWRNGGIIDLSAEEHNPTITCTVCHRSETGFKPSGGPHTFLGESAVCVTCHKSGDILGVHKNNCQNCHTDAPPTLADPVDKPLVTQIVQGTCTECHGTAMHDSESTHNNRNKVALCATCHAIASQAEINTLHKKCETCHGYTGTKLDPAIVADAIATGKGAATVIDCQTCHTVSIRRTHHSSAKAANNKCVSCHASVNHAPMVKDSVSPVCVGCHSGTAGTTNGIPVNPADPKIHFSCRICHTFDSEYRGILVNFTNRKGVIGNGQLPDGGTIGGSDGGGLCSVCHTEASKTFHHRTPHVSIGECEQCHVDPRPSKGHYQPGDNGGASQYPTQLACRECHVRFVDGALTVIKYTRTDYVDLSTPWIQVTQHTIPGVSQGQINNYGICFSCHGEGTATKVKLFHARPDRLNTNPSWMLGTRNWRRHDAPGPQRARYAAGRSSSGIGAFNYFSDNYEAALGHGLADLPTAADGLGAFRSEYFANAYPIRESGRHWHPYDYEWKWRTSKISIPGSAPNYGYAGIAIVLPAVTQQTITGTVADSVTVDHAVFDGTDLIVIANSSNGCNTLTASYGGINVEMTGSDNCTATIAGVNYPIDGTTVNVTTSNGEGINVIDYPITNQPGGVAVNDFYSAFSGIPKPLAVMVNDLGTGLSLQAVGGAGHGEVAISGDAVLYTATAGYSGKDSFWYTVTDSTGKTSEATVSVTVVINQAPIAGVDAYTVAAGGTQVVFKVLENDTDSEGEPLTITAITQPSAGTAVISGAEVLYTPPAAGSDGETAFTYQISDGMGHTVTGEVTVTIITPRDWVTVLNPWQSTPQLNQMWQTTSAADADGYWPVPNLPDFKVSPGLDRLLVMSITVKRSYSTSNAYNEDLVKATYGGKALTKASIHNRIASSVYWFSYTTYLGYLTEADLAAATGSAVTVATRTGYSSITFSIASYSNVNQTTPISYSGGHTYQTSNPYPVITPATTDHSNPNIIPPMVPVPVHAGQYTIYNRTTDACVSRGFKNTDSEGYIENINFVDTTKYVNVGLASKLITADGTTYPIMPIGKCGTYGTSSLMIVNNVSGNSKVVDVSRDVDTDHDGVVEPLDQCPNTSIGQSVNSNGCALSQLDSDNDLVSDTLDLCPNTPTGQAVVADGCPAGPVAVNDSYPVYSGIGKSLAVMVNDTGTGILSLQSVGTAGHGQVVITGDTVLYTSTTGYSGADSFSYTITDINGKTSQATVSVTVALNQAPIAGADTYTVAAGSGQVVFNVLVNDSDADGEPLAITDITQPSAGTAVINNGTNILFTPPPAGFDGNITFTYQITDGMNHTVSGEVTVTIATPRDWVTVLDPWQPTPQLSQKWQSSSWGADGYLHLPNDTNFTVSPGLNRLLVMSITVYATGGTSTKDLVVATYGGKTLTKAYIAQSSANAHDYITYLGYLKEADIAVAIGNTVTVATATGYYSVTVSIASYSNVNQTSPISLSGGNSYSTGSHYQIIDPSTAPFLVHAGQYALYNRGTAYCESQGSGNEGYAENINYNDYIYSALDGVNVGLSSKLIVVDGDTNPTRSRNNCGRDGSSSLMILNNVSGVPVVVDTDQDGVIDQLDQCPNTAQGMTVNSAGCEQAVIAFTNSAYSVDEDGGTAIITVSRTGLSTGAVDVNYATGGSGALAGTHYTATSGTLHWGDGEMGDLTFSVPIIDNTTYSINRTVTLQLSTVTGGAVLGTPQWALLTIVDNETPAAIAFASSTYTVNENGGMATITVKRTGNSAGEAKVYYEAYTDGGTAILFTDYDLTMGWLVWADGDMADKEFTIPIYDNTIFGADKTVSLALYFTQGNATLGAPTLATLTIVNDEPLPSSAITLSASVYSVLENDGTATITLSRTGLPIGEVCANYATAAGVTATAGKDYAATPGTLCWGDGDLADKTFEVSVIDNAYHGVNKTVNLALSSPTGDAYLGSPNTAVLTIVDNEVPVPDTTALTSATYSVNENDGTATITFSRFGNATGPLSVGYATTDGGTATTGVDYTATSGTLNWADGDLADKRFTINIIDNAVYAGDKTVNLVTTALGTPNLAVLTIVDNESVITFSSSTYSVDENGGTVVITARRTGSSRGQAVVGYRNQYVPGITTTAESLDFTFQASSQALSWADGDMSDKTFTINIIDDMEVETDEALVLDLENPTGNATLGSQKRTVLTIIDNDDAAIAFTASAFTVKETGGTATITVSRSRYSTGAVGVDYATTTGGTASPGVDYTVTSGTLLWGNNDMADKSFTIPINYSEGYTGSKTVNLTLTSPSGHATIQGVINTAELTITEDETVFVFSAADYSVNEEGGNGKATITVTRLGNPTVGMVSVHYEVANCFDPVTAGRATPWVDFQGCPAGSLYWNATDMTDKTFTITITPDAVHEGDEMVNLRLFFDDSPHPGLSLGTPNTAVLTIIDND